MFTLGCLHVVKESASCCRRSASCRTRVDMQSLCCCLDRWCGASAFRTCTVPCQPSHVTPSAHPLPAEVVEVVHYKGPINATIIRRHQQWLDAAQVRGSEVVWLVCSWSQRMRWCGRPVEQGTAVANHCRLPTAARPRPTHPPTHPSTHPPRCLPCLSGCRPAPRGTRLPSSCGSTPRWPSPKTCRRPPAAAACRRGRGRRPPTATRGR